MCERGLLGEERTAESSLQVSVSADLFAFVTGPNFSISFLLDSF